MSKKKGGSMPVALLISVIWLGVNYYIYYPAINIQNQEFWFWLLFHSVVISLIFIFVGIVGRSRKERFTDGVKKNFRYFTKENGRVQLILLVLIPVFCVLVLFFGNLAGTPVFNAKRYSKLLAVEQRDVTEDIPESENVDNIALMDTNSARIFGNRRIGSLSDVVSQYEVEDAYTQINLKDTPMKVANLKYADFFKYLSNRKNGIPGYVMVNPVDSTSQYVKLAKGMKYVPSGYFNDNIYRYVQMHNPTRIFDGCYFEVKDDGSPCYVCPVLHARVGLFGGMDVKGAVLLDPVTGDMQYYDVADIPNWVDRVYDGDLLEDKFNWYGELSNGFWNSVIGQKGCIRATDDYGFKTIEDDVWIYTGVTSVTGDASNVGFVMINQRTSEARYYTISGAEEYSAMSSAEGEVQEKNYKASFPSLINVDGTPTYVMVLTDNGGLVKMYAMVNVEQYNLVVTAESQEEVFAKYRQLLAKEGISDSGAEEETTDTEKKIQSVTFVVADMEYVTMDGETYVYLKNSDGEVYKQKFADDESIVKVSVGDEVTVQYEKKENGIHRIITIEITQKSVTDTQSATTESATTEAGVPVTGVDKGAIKEDRPVVTDGDTATEEQTSEEQTSEEKTTEDSSTEKEDGSI
ncbi:putative uncharacterized protein [Clostridium sp. CAG:590]|nr:putative uncharacterized protein [Clostridium sp. CAG:590]